jgi:hypothetical protein
VDLRSAVPLAADVAGSPARVADLAALSLRASLMGSLRATFADGPLMTILGACAG